MNKDNLEKFDLTLEVSISKNYTVEAKNRDEAEALAFSKFKEKCLTNEPLDYIDGFARFH